MALTDAKVLQRVADHRMIHYPVTAALALSPDRVVVVVGYQADRVRAELAGYNALETVDQPEQRGTADAVGCAKPLLKDFAGDMLILYGDTPLIEADDLKQLLAQHRLERNLLTFVSTKLHRPHGYGRVVRDAVGKVRSIVEEKDATAEQRLLQEINVGIYLLNANFLWQILAQIRPINAQCEYYLTDLVAVAAARGEVGVYQHPDPETCLGVNTVDELARAEKILERRRGSFK